MKTVTLDALIPREDFDILSELGGNNNTRNKATLSNNELIHICDKLGLAKTEQTERTIRMVKL